MNNNSDQNRPSDHSNTANQTTDDNTILNTNTSHPLLPTTPLLHDQFAGDILNEAKEPNTTRIYAQNINGIKWDNDGGTWPMICETMSSIHADIACLTELNLDIHNHKLSTTMHRIERRFFNQSRFAGSTSTNKVPHTYKPGGTGTLVVNKMTATIKKFTRDRMGRWVITHLAGNPGTHIAIITAYQVCQKTITGNATAANCQIARLIEEEPTLSSMPNPRLAFISDLSHSIKQLQLQGTNIILVGDFNEEIAPGANQPSGISTLATECELADIFAVRLGTSTNPPTYRRGRKRLDYALISPHLLPAIKAAGYDPFNYRIPSDHRGFFLDFDSEMLLGYSPTTLAPPSSRDFNSRQPKAVVEYITAIVKELNHHNFWEKLERLKQATSPRPLLAEKIDRDLTRAAKFAAKKIKRRYQTPWSPAFAKAWATIHFFKIAKSRLKNPHIDYTPAFQQWQNKYPHLPPTIPTTHESIDLGMRVAIQQLKEAKQHAFSLRQEHLEERARLYATMEDMGNKKAVDRLKRAELLSQTYRKLSSIRKPNLSWWYHKNPSSPRPGYFATNMPPR